MKKVLQFSFVFPAFLLSLLVGPYGADAAETGRNRVGPTAGSPATSAGNILIAENRFIDNGNGTVTDTRTGLMWQQSDSEKLMTFQEARDYCKTLRLGGHADWRLPGPAESSTAVVVELMMPKHSPAPDIRFDLYWSSEPTVLLPFNYHPSRGKPVQRAYPAGATDKAYVRAVRSLRGAGNGSGG